MTFNWLWLHGPLRIEDLMDGKEWELLTPIAASWVEDDGARKSIIVPAGFKTDLSSVPRMFRSIVPQLGKYNLPSVIHDYCYATHMFDSRLKCDDLFLEGMTRVGTNWARRNAMYSAVRLGGWVPYNKHKVEPHEPTDSL